MILLLSLTLASITLIAAQDEPPPEPPPDSGLDVVPEGTPLPLPTRMPRPASFVITENERAQLIFFFEALPQGQTGLMRVVGNEIANVRALFLGDLIDFFPAEDDFYGLLSAGMEQITDRDTALAVYITFTDGDSYHNSAWTIDIPNKQNPDYITNANAYALALESQANAVFEVEDARQLIAEQTAEINANPRNEEIVAAQGEIDKAKARIVQIDAQKHPEEAEEVDFQDEANGELEEDQIDGQRLGDTEDKVGGEDRLNCAMWGHDPEDFPQYSAQ